MGVAPSTARKARTMASVFASVWPALSARCEESWIAGPSAIGSVNGMPSSITSAPAAGSAHRIASEVSGSGSPAVRNVTSAARPARARSAKRASIRVALMSIRQAFAAALAQRGHADIDGAEHQDQDRADEMRPFPLADGGADVEKPHPPEKE